MQKARFIIALVVFFSIAFALPFLANLLPDHTRTLANAPEVLSRAYIDRVVNFVVSGKRPDIVMAGSSLVIFPHVLCDGYFEKVPVPVPDPIEYADFLNSYTEMAHFKKLYAQTSPGNPSLSRISVVDLGVPSLMLTDCLLLFEKLQLNDALPKTVVLLLAPRDFMDNTVAAERNLFRHEIEGRVTLKELVNSKDTISFFANLMQSMNYVANAWFRQFRTSGQRIILAIKKAVRKHQKATVLSGPTIEEAKRYFYFGKGKLSDLGIYKKRYNPADRARIQEQMKAMEMLLDRLKKKSVNVVVVNMPLTKENRALIEKSALDEIQAGMKSLCSRVNVHFVEGESLGPWDNSLFVDSVHLNAKGGDRLFVQLSEILSKNKPIAL